MIVIIVVFLVINQFCTYVRGLRLIINIIIINGIILIKVMDDSYYYF